VVAVAITVYTGGATGALWSQALYGQAFAVAVAGGFAAGAVQSGTLKGGLQGAFSAAIFFGIGSYFDQANSASSWARTGDKLNTIGRVSKIVAHGAAGGIMSDLQGGKFAHGFASAGFSEAAGPLTEGIQSDFLRGAAHALIGGSASSLSGGKFANGAVTGAMSFAFNTLVHEPKYGPADPAKGAAAAAEANAALEEAGLFKVYGAADDLQLAKDWAGVVHPISEKHGVEIGADIFAVEGGLRVGLSISSGQPHMVRGLGSTTLSGGTRFGAIHTHPSAITFSGSAAGYDLRTAAVSYPQGSNWSSFGDLRNAYDMGINAYVALPGGRLDYWRYSDYQAVSGSDYFVPFGRATQSTTY
jgi:hypothetical protein